MNALVHEVPETFDRCVTTHISKRKPDLQLAREQWTAYCQRLESIGCELHVLNGNSHLPDSPFVEDTGIVVDGVFVQASMSAPTRRDESRLVAAHFSQTHRVVRLQSPARMDGGDVLRIGERLFVGLSGRTNRKAVNQLERLLDVQVVPVPIQNCLHLKTAVTALDQETLLLNPRWVEPATFSGFRTLEVPDSEPFSANVLKIGTTLTVAAGYPRRADLLERAGFEFLELDISEFEKAEAGMTCLSLLY